MTELDISNVKKHSNQALRDYIIEEVLDTQKDGKATLPDILLVTPYQKSMLAGDSHSIQMMNAQLGYLTPHNLMEVRVVKTK